MGVLKDQIQQMSEGQGVIGCLVPMDETNDIPSRFNDVLFVRPSYVYGKIFSKKSFSVY